MEILSRLRWLIIGFFVLLFLILVGWGLSSIARNIFTGDTTSPSTEEAQEISAADLDVLKFSVDGPVVASKEHQSYVVEVSPNVVIFRLYSDYGNTIITEKSYLNTEEGFNSFASALDKANVTSRIRGTTTDDDFNEKGSCPEGRRYVVELEDAARRWFTSCNSAKGTAGGSVRTIRSLFNKQVPDIRDLLSGTGLYVQ